MSAYAETLRKILPACPLVAYLYELIEVAKSAAYVAYGNAQSIDGLVHRATPSEVRKIGKATHDKMAHQTRATVAHKVARRKAVRR